MPTQHASSLGVIEQIVRDPTLTDEPAYHDRITSEVTLAAILDRVREMNILARDMRTESHNQALRLIWGSIA